MEVEVVAKQQEIRTLKNFYGLMVRTRAFRLQVVENIFGEGLIDPALREGLKEALALLENIPRKNDRPVLVLDEGRMIEVDLTYEIKELRKDIVYLERGEEELIGYLEKLHPGLRERVDQVVEKFRGLRFNCFITDRDGTINNYCGRYRSSIQSAYNSAFLTRFAKNRTLHSIVVTSAPLEAPGILDVSIDPKATMIFAASKGREFVDLSGKRRTHPIDEKKQTILDSLNERLSQLVKEPAFERYSLIGSGLQIKFGQTTIARQDISRSIPEAESEGFLKKIETLVTEIDPQREHFRIEDTGLDIEIHLATENSHFDKGDGVKYLEKELNLEMAKGPHLICGDTFSDIPMVEASMKRSRDTWAIFVTRDAGLAERVKSATANSFVVPEPDVLVTILALLSRA